MTPNDPGSWLLLVLAVIGGIFLGLSFSGIFKDAMIKHLKSAIRNCEAKIDSLRAVIFDLEERERK